MNIKHKFLIGLSLVPFLFITGCTSKPEAAVEPEVETPVEVEEIIEEAPVEIDEVEEVVEVTEEPDEVEEVQEVYDEDEVEFIDDNDDEYLRSIDSLSSDETVTRTEFFDDKTAVISIINNLSTVISSQNFNEWKKYIDQESIEYYQNPANLRAAQKKLPNKTIQLKGLKDYFINVFIPSRQRSQVDEIRYISKTNIKAVQVKPDLSTIVYYYFVKIDGKWYVHLPPVS